MHVSDRGQGTGDEGPEWLRHWPVTRWQSDRCESGRTPCVSATAVTNRELFEIAVESLLETSSPAMIPFATYSSHISAHFQERYFHFSNSFFIGRISVLFCFLVFFSQDISDF